MSVSILDSAEGVGCWPLGALTAAFESVGDAGTRRSGPHPVVPLMVRDTAKTTALVRHLHDNGILATGLKFPVVPKGDEEIRFQVNADHTAADIDHVLATLRDFHART
jgi:glycine C-acetyltransferase